MKRQTVEPVDLDQAASSSTWHKRDPWVPFAVFGGESNGIGFGFISYVVFALVTGKAEKLRPLMWVATIAHLVCFPLAYRL